MPRQNYYQPRERTDPRTEKLQQLAVLAQVLQGIQGPQAREREGQQQQALGLLGLALQAQNQQGQLAETARAHDLQSGEGWAQIEQNRVNAEGLQKHHAALALEQMNQTGEARRANDLRDWTVGEDSRLKWAGAEADKNQREAMLALEAQKIFQEQQNQQRLAATGGLQALVSAGGTPQQIMQLGQEQNIPGFAATAEKTALARAMTQAGEMKMQFGAGYDMFGKDPKGGQNSINATWNHPYMQDPMVQKQMWEYIQQRDRGLAEPQVPSPGINLGSANAVGQSAGKGLAHLLYGGILDAPSTAYNATVVPGINALSGLFGGPQVLPKAGTVTDILKRKGYLNSTNY